MRETGEFMDIKGTLRLIGALQGSLGILVFAAGLLLHNFGLMICISAVTLLAAGIILIWIMPGQIDAHAKRLQGQQRKDTLQVLSLYRHDVMNQVQLIKGYTQMQKFDRLQSPVQKLVQDAQRQSALSNLPGEKLPYLLTLKDLSAPLVHLHIQWGESRFQFMEESDWIAVFERFIQLGEQAAHTTTMPVNWQLLIEEDVQQALIQLDVFGEDVNDTYIAELMQYFSREGWNVRNIGEIGQQYRFELQQAR